MQVCVEHIDYIGIQQSCRKRCWGTIPQRKTTQDVNQMETSHPVGELDLRQCMCSCSGPGVRRCCLLLTSLTTVRISSARLLEGPPPSFPVCEASSRIDWFICGCGL
jgi:hypothetical protein